MFVMCMKGRGQRQGSPSFSSGQDSGWQARLTAETTLLVHAVVMVTNLPGSCGPGTVLTHVILMIQHTYPIRLDCHCPRAAGEETDSEKGLPRDHTTKD